MSGAVSIVRLSSCAIIFGLSITTRLAAGPFEAFAGLGTTLETLEYSLGIGFGSLHLLYGRGSYADPQQRNSAAFFLPGAGTRAYYTRYALRAGLFELLTGGAVRWGSGLLDFTAESGWAVLERYSWKDSEDGPDDAYKSKETFSRYEGYDITLGVEYSFSSIQIGLDMASRLYPQRESTEVIVVNNAVDPEELKKNQERKFITYRQVLPRIQISKKF